MNKFDLGLPKFEDTLFSTEEQRQEARLEKVMKIPISEIHDFKQHPFHVRMDEDMVKLIDSVKENGVLMPALVRPDKNGGYEMVSGHRRKFALEQNGITEIDAIVRELDDDQATIIMVDSNIQREHILPTERGFAYRMKLEAMKRQGKRTDLTSYQNETKLRSDEILSRQVGESRAQVQRYIRLTELIPELLDMVDAKKLNFTIAVDISYIDKEMQKWIYEYIRDTGFIKPKQITALRKQLEEGPVNQGFMISIFNSCIVVKAPERKWCYQERSLQNIFRKTIRKRIWKR